MPKAKKVKELSVGELGSNKVIKATEYVHDENKDTWLKVTYEDGSVELILN